MSKDVVIVAQTAPFPFDLEWLVNNTRFRGNWTAKLYSGDRGQGCAGFTLEIVCWVPDSYERSEDIRVRHLFPVPPAAYDRRNWRRWLLDRYRDVDTHEAMELFEEVAPCPNDTDGDGDCDACARNPLAHGWYKPYAPSHGPGNDPYTIREYAEPELRAITSRGELQGHFRITCGLGFSHGAGGFLTRAGAWGYLNEMPSCSGAHAVEFVPRGV